MRSADPSEPDGSGAVAPDAAVFELLGNDIRLGIVRELAAAGAPVAFSRLRERVGVDDSGKFNYHLGRLEGRFVVKQEEGYGLTECGRAVVELIDVGMEPLDERRTD